MTIVTLSSEEVAWLYADRHTGAHALVAPYLDDATPAERAYVTLLGIEITTARSSEACETHETRPTINAGLRTYRWGALKVHDFRRRYKPVLTFTDATTGAQRDVDRVAKNYYGQYDVHWKDGSAPTSLCALLGEAPTDR